MAESSFQYSYYKFCDTSWCREKGCSVSNEYPSHKAVRNLSGTFLKFSCELLQSEAISAILAVKVQRVFDIFRRSLRLERPMHQTPRAFLLPCPFTLFSTTVFKQQLWLWSRFWYKYKSEPHAKCSLYGLVIFSGGLYEHDTAWERVVETF